MNQKYCLALDLKDDPALIAEYETCHQQVWAEIIASIKGAGIVQMEIFRTGNRLVMVMETTEDFSFEKKAAADQSNPRVQEWKQLMWKYQQALPGSQHGQKWVVMKKFFSL